jgi:hypothetical protein
VNVGLVRSDKAVAEIEAADRIPFQVLPTHREKCLASAKPSPCRRMRVPSPAR